MSAFTKGRTGRSRLRRPRDGRPGRAIESEGAPAPAPGPIDASGSAAARPRRTAGLTQDTALYTCQCGLVFEADVSTSVGCPHCGGTQAW